ncbi:glycosyltransferase [Microbacterium trichothecenolyticum]|uniref:Glycosyltransferase involved in cell wall biosynthesis n=1 Tax=Microbacterium trichothecenolyticum TaxID=69370 RepID=A0ABU0TXX2_MICTR|nr:glycosyltransferase [Microbacterium trichothecenolyticum]MDQ1124484.1 glycosyltransferase involved in cell wall biosynthesis [Microbacterium trichothecenolyticum]
MKIAHVVTYSSSDGAFGGPTRVAFAQAKALADKGHDVTVYAGSPRDEVVDAAQDGYRLRTFPVRRLAPFGGFATLWPDGMRRVLARDLASTDVAHIHLARDMTTLPAAVLAGARGVPYVVQTHGMVDASDRLLAKVLDLAATRRVLRRARAWLVLTDDERSDLSALARSERVVAIANGVEPAPMPAYDGRPDEVVFLARLHERKRPLVFVEMARALSERLPTTTFRIFGPDEGEGEKVTAAIAASGMGERLTWAGALPPAETAQALAAARVYVLPSVNEVFPMSILEAFNAGTPVVTTASLGIAETCERYDAAIVTDGSAAAMADAVHLIYSSPMRAQELREGAERYVSSELDIAAVAATLENEYVLATRGGKDG